MELEIAKCQKAVNGALRNQTFLAIANEVSSTDTDEMTAREKANRERRTLKAAYWVLAVEVYLKRKQALKESKGLFQIGPICDIRREIYISKDKQDTENKETTKNEYINYVASKRNETYEEKYSDDNSESSVAETVDSENPSYESDFSEEPHGGDSEIHILTGCQLSVEQKYVYDEKQEPIYNQETYIESKSNGTEMIKDVMVMVESFKKDDGGPTDNTYTRVDLIDAGEARTRNSILGTRQGLQKMDYIDFSKAANQCFDNNTLPSDGLYLKKDQNANDDESFTVSSASFDSFFGYDNPDTEEDDLPNENDKNLMENRPQSFKMNEKPVEVITGGLTFNDNERHHGTCFSKQDINNLDELVANVSKISRLMKQHSNTESEDQLQSSKQNVEKSMAIHSFDFTTVSSDLGERQFESENLMKGKEGTEMEVMSNLENSL